MNAMRLLGEVIDPRANGRLLWTEYRAFAALLLFTAFLDMISTIAFMSIFGPERELHGFVRTASLSLGIVAGPAVGKLIQLFAVWGLTVLTPRLTRLLCTVVILMNLTAFVANMRVFASGS